MHLDSQKAEQSKADVFEKYETCSVYIRLCWQSSFLLHFECCFTTFQLMIQWLQLHCFCVSTNEIKMHFVYSSLMLIITGKENVGFDF